MVILYSISLYIIYIYIYIYIYIHTHINKARPARVRLGDRDPGPEPRVGPHRARALRGNHLSNTTCLTQGFFKSGQDCSKS